MPRSASDRRKVGSPPVLYVGLWVREEDGGGSLRVSPLDYPDMASAGAAGLNLLGEALSDGVRAWGLILDRIPGRQDPQWPQHVVGHFIPEAYFPEHLRHLVAEVYYVGETRILSNVPRFRLDPVPH